MVILPRRSETPRRILSMKHSKTSARAAFTLIEQLVVIAIIAIMAGLLFPVIGKVKLRGIETRTTSNLRQIAAAMGAYGGEHDTSLPGPLTVEQYPVFGLDPKRDTGSLAKILATYLGLTEKKDASKDQSTAGGVLSCPGATGEKLDEIPGYIMNMHPLPDYTPAQPAWGDVDASTLPLKRVALSSWKDESRDAVTKDAPVNLTQKWAMRHTDQKDCAKLELTGEWVQKLPKEPVFDDHYQALFFDLHVEAYKPKYEKETGD